jgi:peroxiredoxin family protein
MMETPKEKMTIIFFSGTLDKALAMLILSTTAASLGMEVSVFFTFWGLNFLKKDTVYKKKNVLQKMMEFMTPKNMNSLPLSNMNMLGMGPVMMKKLMKSSKMPDIGELFKLAREFKVKFYPCSTSCGMMGVTKENMIEGAEAVVGAATFLKLANEAKINLFI